MLDKIFAYLTRHSQSVYTPVQTREASPLSARDISAPSTVVVDPLDIFGTPGSSALAVSTVYRCVELLSRSVARLPLREMRRNATGQWVVREGVLTELLSHQPCEESSAFDQMEGTVAELLLAGNAYLTPRGYDSHGEPLELLLLNRGCCSYEPTTDTYKVNDAVNEIAGNIPASNIVHIHLACADRRNRVGLSVLARAARTIDIARTGERETGKRFEARGNVRGILTTQKASLQGMGNNAPTELEGLADKLNRDIDAGKYIHAVPGAVGYTSLTVTPSDMQFLETRKFTVREICRFFGVHPSYVYDDTSNNYKSAEMSSVAFLTDTLDPLLRKIEAEMTRKLIPRHLWGERRIEFDRTHSLAADPASRVKFFTDQLAGGMITPNEARGAVGRAPVPGGDALLVSANLRPLDQSITPNA